MHVDIDKLYSKISTIPGNQNYRFGDVIKGTNLPDHYKVDINALTTEKEYSGTILQAYCQQVRDIHKHMNWEEKAQILYHIVYKYIETHNLPIAEKDELVLHMRLGDAVITNEQKDSWIHNTRCRIYNKYNMYHKITLLTALNYGDHTDGQGNKCYNHTPGMDQLNRDIFTTAVKKLASYYNDINVYSHNDPDIDFCYAMTSRQFEGDYRGFSEVITNLRNNYNL